jgi:tripartite-type tricarboxylate transporter receptor subunit TctC
LPSVLPLVQEGKLRAIAVTSAQRVPFLPDLPTIAETLPEFDVTSWLGIMVPAGTPADIRARIAAPLATFVRDPATVKRLQELGAVAASVDTPQAFDAWIRRDYEKWRRVVKETGIRIGK